MSSLSAVVDAVTVIGAAKGDVFDLLGQLYATVYVPTEVVAEVVHRGQGRPGAPELARALGHWIIEVTPDPQRVRQFASSISLADRQVLAVAEEHGVDHILSNDNHVRREAAARGFTCIETPSLIVLMKDRGLVTAVGPALDRMRLRGYGIDDRSYEDALRAAGEASS